MVLLRVAALVAILGAVGVLIWNEMTESEEPVTLSQRVASTASRPSELSEPVAAPGYRKLGAIDVSELADASFSNMPVSDPQIVHGKNLTQLPVAIPDKVDQVWSVPARSAFREENVQKLVRALGIPDGNVEFQKNGNQFSVSFRGTKMQSVRFVRSCKAIGCSLLSPVQPQPEQDRFAGHADSMIRYSATFIRR